ncbi:MAG: ATP-dependent Clp protease ATP-binding subunit [Parcubacteria group bacterium]|nr:ATP-dependent Clp protease ATP-binding subunit [Parcubacteria group bacterium]
MRKEDFPIQIDLEKKIFEIDKIEREMNQEIIGQSRAIRKIMRSAAIYLAKVKNPLKPIDAFIFSGPTGVGKTYTAETFAWKFIGGEGSDAPLTKINCSELSEKHLVTRLTGGAPTFVGYGDPTQLDQFSIDSYHFREKAKEEISKLKIPIEKFIELGSDDKDIKANRNKLFELYLKYKPYRSVVLFDEIEEAHPAVYKLLLQILDDGLLRMGDGSITSFRDSEIFLTTNIGSDKIKNIMNPGMGFHADIPYKKKLEAAGNGEIDKLIYREVRDEIIKHKDFPPKFIGRFRDKIVVFRTLKHDHYLEILNRQFLKIQDRIAHSENPFLISGYSNEVKEFLLQKGINPEYGARPLNAAIEKYLTFNLSKALLAGEIVKGDEVFVDIENDKIVLLRKNRPKNHKKG